MVIARPIKSSTRRAFSLLEVVFSMLLTGLLIVPTLSMLGSVSSSYASTQQRQTAFSIGHSLICEIVSMDFEDADSPVFGPESNEATRLDFDDVDDFDGWIESPPTDSIGGKIDGSEHFEVSVSIDFVSLINPNQASASATGLKQIQVNVTSARLRQPIVLTALKSSASPFEHSSGYHPNLVKRIDVKVRNQGGSVSQRLSTRVLNQRPQASQ